MAIEWAAQFLRASGDKMMIMVESQENPDKQGAARPRQPVQQMGYSGHTAWVMAIISELAYMRFEEEYLNSLLVLTDELAKALGRFLSDAEAQALEGLLATRDNRDNQLLRGVLAAGGFELVGALSDLGTDTQGFIAVRRAGDERDMAVVSFRGTEKIKDWETNLRHSLTPADLLQSAANGQTAKVHQGFLDAFTSVRDQVERCLPCAEGLPVFITGHSLGGALATLTAAYLSGWGPVACYTFGAPRVGDKGFSRSLRTPVYRVVNPLDTVPSLPGCWQGYRHAGTEKKLGWKSSFDRLRGFRNGLVRLWRSARGQGLSLYLVYDAADRWHNIRVYREKLRDDADGLA